MGPGMAGNAAGKWRQIPEFRDLNKPIPFQARRPLYAIIVPHDVPKEIDGGDTQRNNIVGLKLPQVWARPSAAQEECGVEEWATVSMNIRIPISNSRTTI